MLSKVSRFLFKYRATPHSTTLRSPAELFLGRQFRTHLDTLRPDVRDRVRRRQWAQKSAADRGTKERHCMPGDAVYVSAVDRLRGVDGVRWLPAVVVSRKDTEVVVRLTNGSVLRRHVDCVRRRYGSDTGLYDDIVEVPPVIAPNQQSAAGPADPVGASGQRVHGYNLRPRELLRPPQRLQC